MQRASTRRLRRTSTPDRHVRRRGHRALRQRQPMPWWFANRRCEVASTYCRHRDASPTAGIVSRILHSLLRCGHRTPAPGSFLRRLLHHSRLQSWVMDCEPPAGNLRRFPTATREWLQPSCRGLHPRKRPAVCRSRSPHERSDRSRQHPLRRRFHPPFRRSSNCVLADCSASMWQCHHLLRKAPSPYPTILAHL